MADAADLLNRIRVNGAVPRHVAIIMDGNGRWARERMLPRPAGHRFFTRPARTGERAARRERSPEALLDVAGETVHVARLFAHLVRGIFLRAGVADPGDDALAAFCRARLASYKVPRAFIRLTVLPRTASGKLRRGELREVLG